jgi:Flp pilus assembly pilin Flp
MFDSERGGLFPPTRRVARRRSRIFLTRDGQTHAEFGVIVVVVSIVAIPVLIAIGSTAISLLSVAAAGF